MKTPCRLQHPEANKKPSFSILHSPSSTPHFQLSTFNFQLSTILLLLVLCGSSLNVIAQDTLSDVQKSWHDKGFDFTIAGGVYFGNKYTANYYNGNPQNENNINMIFENKYLYDDVNKWVLENVREVSDSVFLGTLPDNMSYSPAMSISLGAKYKFNKNWGISLNYYFAKLTATDIFTLTYKAPDGNIDKGYLMEYLIGKESRSIIELSISYLLHPNKIVKPFFELGVQFNYVNVNQFIALIEDREYQLLDYYQGDYYPGGQQIDNYVKYGGAGYGLSFVAGLKLAINPYISLDPLFYLSASSIGLNGYRNSLHLNYGAYVRVVVSDLIFSKNK